MKWLAFTVVRAVCGISTVSGAEYLRWSEWFVGFLPYQVLRIYGSWNGLQDSYRTKAYKFTVVRPVCEIPTVCMPLIL